MTPRTRFHEHIHQHRKNWYDYNVLHMDLILDAGLFRHRCSNHDDPAHPSDDLLLVKVAQQYQDVRHAIKEFDNTVWLKGLGRQFTSLPTRGARLEGLTWGQKVLLYTLAGRVLITVKWEHSGGEFTLITDDALEEPRMGLQSINNMSSVAVVEDLHTMTRAFQCGELTIVPDKEVGLLW